MLGTILLATVIFSHNGHIGVGEVVKRSGNITYVMPCERRDRLHLLQLNAYEIIRTKREISCREYLDSLK